MKDKKNNKKTCFSKALLIQESILVWLSTIAFITLAFYNTTVQYIGDLTWLGVLCTAIWAAYGVSQVWYYKKSAQENGTIVYDLTMKEFDLEHGILGEEKEEPQG